VTGRLLLWAGLVLLMISAAFYGRATEGKPNPNTLYEYSSAAQTLVNYAVILVLVLAIASFRRDLLALRRPRWSIGRIAGVSVLLVIGVYVVEGVYAWAVQLGNEQGLTPDRWQPRHAAAYVVNGIVICTVIPLVEELTFRGLGYALLERFGRWFAIVAVGVLFGLAHGLLLSFPILALFGCVVAWVRSRTGSVFPGMALHALFNAIALVAAVTLSN
jgi:uncharacterized protein